MEMLEEHRCFEGWQQRWRHDSATLNCANFPKITVIENKMKVDEMVTVRDITLTST
ncbi:hypothetical protein V4S89_21845, partial [Citrobacter freundii]|uniref:hypothetical protein n=1 Tax=Citrobacter freundii TaxID=546 RepID=UPI002F96DEA8